MYAKSLLIPIAALVLSASNAYAFESSILEKAGLTHAQKSAFESARERKEKGDIAAAQQVLVDAGVDIKTLELVRIATAQHRQAKQQAIVDALRSNDYEGFKNAIEGLPLADIVITEHDFSLFRDAYAVDISQVSLRL